jgi:hypothetical protein
VDRSLRRRGQLLVVAGALLGAVIGAGLSLVVGDPVTSRAGAVPARERGVTLAATPPSSQPPASRAAVSSGNPADGNDPSGTQRSESADRAGKRDGKAGKNGEGHWDQPGHGRNEPGHGNDEAGKGKDKPGKDK